MGTIFGFREENHDNVRHHGICTAINRRRKTWIIVVVMLLFFVMMAMNPMAENEDSTNIEDDIGLITDQQDEGPNPDERLSSDEGPNSEDIQQMSYSTSDTEANIELFAVAEDNEYEPDPVVSIGEELKQCQQAMWDQIGRYQYYVNRVDLWIVSHGGVGSNALIKYLEANTTIGTSSTGWYANICHLAVRDMITEIRDPNLPIIVIVGDIWGSMVSQERRGFYAWNVGKMRFGVPSFDKDIPGCHEPLEWHLKNFPDDPAAIKMMLRAYQGLPNVVFLKAPYTKKGIIQALELLGFHNAESELAGFHVQERTAQNRSAINWPQLLPMYAPYVEIQSALDNQPNILDVDALDI